MMSHVSLRAKSPTDTNPHTGSGELPYSKSPTHPQSGSRTDSGPESLCKPWREQFIRAVNVQISVHRIYQDLVLDHQFSGSYYSVRRFVLRLGIGQPLPFRRMECEPGEQA
jgi:hypothetical protein